MTAVNDREGAGRRRDHRPAAPGRCCRVTAPRRPGCARTRPWVSRWSLSGGGTAGGGGTGTVRPTLSGLPWYNGVFDNTNASTAKVDAFAAMSTRPIDVVDAHPDWVDLPGGTGKDWWYAAHVGGLQHAGVGPAGGHLDQRLGASAWRLCGVHGGGRLHQGLLPARARDEPVGQAGQLHRRQLCYVENAFHRGWPTPSGRPALPPGSSCA